MIAKFKSLVDKQLLRVSLAEFCGTFFLVLFGCGSCTKLTRDDAVQISLVFGLLVAAMVHCFGHVSGCHINPAVTCGMLIADKISVIQALCYILCQCVGSFVAISLLTRLIPHYFNLPLSLTTLNTNVTSLEGFGIEFFITFVLVFTVCVISDKNRNDIGGSGPLAVGIAITTGHLFAVKFTGAGMNPARSFGPALASTIWKYDSVYWSSSSIWKSHWVYWLGPCLGGIGSALLYQFIFSSSAPLLKPSDQSDENRQNAITTCKVADENRQKDITTCEAAL